MKISNELLAAYAEGNVSTEERNVVRQYLAEYPQELESVMMMMDEDYELEVGDIEEYTDCSCNNKQQTSFHDIALSAAAFAPLNINSSFQKAAINTERGIFNQRMEALIEELGF